MCLVTETLQAFDESMYSSLELCDVSLPNPLGCQSLKE